MSHAAPAPPRTERSLQLAYAAVAVAVLLHVDHTPLWCSLTAAGALGWRWAAARGLCALPSVLLRTALTIVLGLLTLGLFRSVGGLGAGSALLMTMAALKLLETRTARDGRVLIAAALFLLVAACLDRQALTRLPLYAVSVCVSCAAGIALGSPAATAGLALRAAARSLAFALPFAIGCFLFFPRLSGPLWGTPEAARATTGLSDEMSPGSITELVTSDDIALRVRFDSQPPPLRERYWRGPVLHDFDGFTWRRAGFPMLAPLPLPDDTPRIAYEVTLEPSGHGVWLTLDTPDAIEAPPGQRALISFDRQALGLRPVTQVITYRARSANAATPDRTLPAFARRLDLQLPPERNPRSLALARSLRAAQPSDAAFAKALLDYFRTQGFRYSLTPPALQRDAVDDLLFRTREGFCGHYASAFTTLLRAGGVPARVVTGYLGGDWNAYGGYYVVRQSAAHAWTEAWLEGRGWTRIDPTAVVEPGRLDTDLRRLLPDTSALRRPAWLGTLADYWDAGNQWWQQRVVGFDLRSQHALLDRIGLPDADYRTLAALLAGTGGAWLAILAWRLQRSTARVSLPLARAWNALRTTLEASGVTGLATAGPLDLARRARLRFAARADLADLCDELDRIAGAYAGLRYGTTGAGTPSAADLTRRIRRLRWQLLRRRILHP